MKLLIAEDDRTSRLMPGMSGAELALALREVRPNLPVIICSGYSDQVDAAGARALGIRGYVNKPIDTAKFLELVEELLQ